MQLFKECMFCSQSLITKFPHTRTMACGHSNLVNFFKCETPCRSISSSLSPTATVMYTGGTIRPVIEGSMAKVDAIGFHDGKVFAVGSLKYVKTKMESLSTCYNTVNLTTGQTLIPGMIDPHVHIVPGSMIMNWNDFGPFDEGLFRGQYLRATYNLDFLEESIAQAKSDLQASGDLERGGWILGYSVDPSLMPFTVTLPANGRAVLISLDVDTVDSMENTTPVFMLSASGHTGYVNTPALQLVYNDNPDIQNTYPTFQDFRDHVNQGGGLQEIPELAPVLNSIPEFQLNVDIVSNIDRYVDTALSRGVTLLYDAGALDSSISDIDSYLTSYPGKIRIGYAKLCETSDDVAKLPEYNPSTEFKNNYHGSVKLVSDGSNQGLTGYQSEPYSCEPADNYGAFNFPPFSQPDTLPDEFAELVQGILDKGWPLMCHGNGDKAISLNLDAYEQALKGESGLFKRHRIEHCSLLDSNALDRMRDLGISPSFLIGHVGYWGYVFKNAIFKDKANILNVCQSAIKKGIRLSLHSDCFVSPLGPLRKMEQAITRIMEGDPEKNVLNETEKITAEQALAIVTNNAAWQCHADQWVGSLEEGKLADYVILAEDPITRADPVGMRDIQVLETWVDGRCVYPLSK